jgi:GxxExxY protein
MGTGFIEHVYQECLCIELASRGIPFRQKAELKLAYKDTPLLQTYEPDFICFDKIILEIKALKDLENENRAQVRNYLKATSFKLGLLVNFGHFPKIQSERIVR